MHPLWSTRNYNSPSVSLQVCSIGVENGALQRPLQCKLNHNHEGRDRQTKNNHLPTTDWYKRRNFGTLDPLEPMVEQEQQSVQLEQPECLENFESRNRPSEGMVRSTKREPNFDPPTHVSKINHPRCMHSLSHGWRMERKAESWRNRLDLSQQQT
ncbi:unnamed protein product [Microthlaspi erraticum]|uniref:Uncharacterized protein n=1 Tax=Microthlaspi erraticum TaxID=1685480 RepID=A0A6D2L1G9_9BRAS|nr:unnamed protein product [Microthlaspi erraticum]